MKLNLTDKFLMDREKRVLHQERLLKRYGDKTLVTVKINYPGINKSNYITDDIVEIISGEINIFFSEDIFYSEEYKSMEGKIFHFIVDECSLEVKKCMIEIEENHILGRFVDIDVYSLEEKEIRGISRRSKGIELSSRRCFICDNDAKICSRSQAHIIDDIYIQVENKYREYKKEEKLKEKFCYELSQFALKAMIGEVSSFPSFGLVSPISGGSHKDMNFYTFLDSAIAITPYFKGMAMIGYSYQNPKAVFKAIRRIGKVCEEKMFEATKNINTHKGMIFLMGIVVTATSKVYYEKNTLAKIENPDKKVFDNIGERIQNTIKEMVEDILDDFIKLKKSEDRKCLTHGEKLYLNYGITGVRGQIKDGLSMIFNDILPRYINIDLCENKLYTQILLELMSVVDDSTIVYRHDVATLKKVQSDAKKLLGLGGVLTEEGLVKANELEKSYIDMNISPGGSADLLAVTIFLIKVLQ